MARKKKQAEPSLDTPAERYAAARGAVEELRKIIGTSLGKEGAEVVPYTKRRRAQDFHTMVAIMTEVIELATAGREKREALEARVAALEKSPLDWKGVWTERTAYSARSVVTFAGSAWYTPVETQAKPGQGIDWKLIVQKGRDGKDAR